MDSPSMQQERARAGLIRALSEAISALEKLEVAVYAAEQERVVVRSYVDREWIKQATRLRIRLENVLEQLSQGAFLF